MTEILKVFRQPENNDDFQILVLSFNGLYRLKRSMPNAYVVWHFDCLQRLYSTV